MHEQALFNVCLSGGNEFGPANMDVLVQWAREGRIPKDAVLVHLATGGEYATEPIRVVDEPRLAAIVCAPPTRGAPLIPPQGGGGDDSVATIIPYRNKPALIGYYLGIVGCLLAILIPILGFAMPIAAMILGVKGLKLAKTDPRAHGTAHAIVALIGGVIGVLFAMGNLAVFIAILAARR